MSENSDSIEASFIISSRAENPLYLEEAIISMLNQTADDIEIVLVLDGADAGQRAFATLAKFSDSRLRCLYSKRRRGLARSLNIAARVSRGHFLARMDDDDRSLPARIEKQISFMRRERVHIAGSYAYLINAQGERDEGVIVKANPSALDNPIGAVFKSILLHPTVMFRRDWILKNKYNKHWGRGQDRELWVRVSSSARFGCIAEPLLEYRRCAAVKGAQLSNVVSAFKLIWVHRSRFGAAFPILLALNSLRWVFYRARICLGHEGAPGN